MPSRRRVAALLASWLLVASVAATAVMTYKAGDMLVHPAREHASATPASVGLAFAPATLVTADGLHLAAWWIPAAHPDAPTVVFLHGYGASKAQALGVAPFLHGAGYSVLAFDFRAHGDSEGTYTTLGLDEVQDVRAAIGFARHAHENASIALFGWSMGAAAALNAARGELGVSAMVLDSPFATLDDVATKTFHSKTGLPDFPFATLSLAWASWMVHHRVSDDRPVEHARSVDVPLLIIQGLSDSIVSDRDARAIHAAAGGSELWLVPRADHVDALRADPQGYEEHVLEFLAASLA